MDESPDLAGAVMDAIVELRRVLNARDWAANAGLKGEVAEIRQCWRQLESALEKAASVIHTPSSGQGLASIWIAAICQHAAKVEAAEKHAETGWHHLLLHDNDNLLWLVTTGWEKGCYILGFGKRRDKPIGRLLEANSSTIERLRNLAEKWGANYPTGSESTSQAWNEQRRQHVGEAASCLLEAINAVEVPPAVFRDEELRSQILSNIDTPTHLIWPRLRHESPGSLSEIVNWLSGFNSEEAPAPIADRPITVTPPQAVNTANLSAPIPKVQSPNGKLKLFKQGEPIELCGRPHPKVTVAQYNVLMTLCIADEAGLTKDELSDKSGHPSARQILTDLLEADARWTEVIQMAGVTGGGYRVL
jgi:hypothetical protein